MGILKGGPMEPREVRATQNIRGKKKDFEDGAR